ncbi:protein of unknown function [Acidithiobacillus ferrivorans]|nr:DUF5397 family protein [Acidithiobacillus ferrivorans]SMH64646.1 protein of unknown function [Acidithiobacillus ferrivorans]
MSNEVDELVDSVTNIGKYLIKRIVAAAHEAERVVVPTDPAAENAKATPSPGATPPAVVDFHLGEWRRFTEFGEAYRVIAPLRQSDGGWIMRIQMKDGTQAEYPLSNILRNPPLVTEIDRAE